MSAPHDKSADREAGLGIGGSEMLGEAVNQDLDVAAAKFVVERAQELDAVSKRSGKAESREIKEVIADEVGDSIFVFKNNTFKCTVDEGVTINLDFTVAKCEPSLFHNNRFLFLENEASDVDAPESIA